VRQAADHPHRRLPGLRCGVDPLLEAAEACTGRSNVLDAAHHFSHGAAQGAHPRHDQHVVNLQPSEHLEQLGLLLPPPHGQVFDHLLASRFRQRLPLQSQIVDVLRPASEIADHHRAAGAATEGAGTPLRPHSLSASWHRTL